MLDTEAVLGSKAACPLSVCLSLTFSASLVSHGGGAAGSASGDKAARLAQGTIHQVPGALQAAEQAHAAGRNPHQSHAGTSCPVAHRAAVDDGALSQVFSQNGLAQSMEARQTHYLH